MSNYPPGVTGMEPEIAGALKEVEERRTCSECSEYVEMLVCYFRDSWVAECPNCGHENSDDLPEYEPDWESIAELRAESREAYEREGGY